MDFLYIPESVAPAWMPDTQYNLNIDTHISNYLCFKHECLTHPQRRSATTKITDGICWQSEKANAHGLPFPLKDYLELVDWTGRIIREDKRGSISAATPPILDRLAIERKHWLL